MKKFIYFAVAFWLHFSTVHAQRNGQWVVGYNQTGVPNGFNDLFIMDFRTPMVTFDLIDTIAFFMFSCNASICDTSGNLLFYTNGVAIMNAEHDTMMNGDNLSPGNLTYYVSNGMLGANAIQSALILPWPDNQDQYVVIHHGDYNSFLSTFPYDYDFVDTLYYSKVDMTMNNGLGEVVNKNQHLWVGDLPTRQLMNPGSITATRHANGRDWWIISHKDSTDQFMNFLLTPQGFQGPFYQSIGPLCFEYKGQSAFSPDGSKYAFFNYGNTRIHLFDFDRCTGLFSNYINITNINAIHYGSIGVAFSPNSRYLYTSSHVKIAQWDTYASNVAASKVVVAEIDSVPCPNYWNQFYLMQLAFDGKIYVSSNNSNHCMTVINDPDVGGTGCNAVPHGLTIPRSNASSVPNHPNYELGALAGSPCDTLTTTGQIYSQQINISGYPNPAQEIFVLTYPAFEHVGKIEIFDVLGGLVLSDIVPPWSQIQKIDISNLSSGIYNCKISWKLNYGMARMCVMQ